MNEQAIGVFDSGVGGLSIWKEITALLPFENTIYLADSKYAPYGQRSKQEIIDLSIKNTELLLKKDCKLIVVACNTATTNAISYLRATYDIPFIGIEPAIKPAALQTKTNAIGILATRGTLTSELFHKTTNEFASNITVIEQIGEGLVPLIESGKIDSQAMDNLLKQYLKPMLEANIDYLVLGCSHYPFLIPKIKNIIGESITIIDSGEAVAKQTKVILERSHLLNTATITSHHELFSNVTLSVLDLIVKNMEVNCDTKLLDF